MANELFGEAHRIFHPKSTAGRDDSKRVEKGSNEASRRYIDQFLSNAANKPALLRQIAQNDALIDSGKGPYANRAAGTEQDADEVTETLRRLNLGR